MIRYQCAKCKEFFESENYLENCPHCAHNQFFWEDLVGRTHRCESCCGCRDCEDKDRPCHYDCYDYETQCFGCYLAGEERREIEFEIDSAQGKY